MVPPIAGKCWRWTVVVDAVVVGRRRISLSEEERERERPT